MRALLVTAALLALANPRKKETKPAADPNAAVAKSHGARVWLGQTPPSEATGTELAQWMAAHPSAREITRKGKDGPWSIQFLAVFRKPAAKGPVIVQFSDKKDPRDVIDLLNLSIDAPTLVFRSNGDLDPDKGFNPGHTYLIKVGQILKKQFVAYATGEFTLK